jgi:hypothetical protein
MKRVERGDRAVVVLPGKQWFSFVREVGDGSPMIENFR